MIRVVMIQHRRMHPVQLKTCAVLWLITRLLGTALTTVTAQSACLF